MPHHCSKACNLAQYGYSRLNLDNALWQWQDAKADQVRSRVAADFTGWEHDNAKFEREFEKLVKALRTDEGSTCLSLANLTPLVANDRLWVKSESSSIRVGKMQSSTLGKRLIRWFFFNLLFALTPLASSLLVRFLMGQLSIQDLQTSSSEILFFSIMVSVTALGDLDDIVKPMGKDTLILGLRLFLIFGAAWSSILYGVFIFDSLNGSNIPGFRLRLFWFSTAVAVVLFLVSTSSQFLLSKIIDTRKKRS